ncbi:MAG: transcriptional repressor [Clostridiales bacterium]|nr:transcriptional repressor [Clostridiales bacterium]
MEKFVNELKEKLKEKGYKLTPQRRAVLEVIISSEGRHLNTEEIYDIVKKNCPDIGLATVYRTIQLLDKLDIISTLYLDDGCNRYEFNIQDGEHHHHHLICDNCSKVIEVKIDLLEKLKDEIQSNYNFVITDHKVQFYGKCEDCK